MAAEFDPKNTNLADDTLGDFLRDDVECDLEIVPGVGKAAAAKLNDAGIFTTYQLIGKFLMFKESEDVRSHLNAFQTWLQEVGVNSHRTTITKAIAEKVDIFLPGTFDATLYE